jgi:uncharacterized phosphosugar-binding protein
MLAENYLSTCLEVLGRVRDEQMGKIQEAARLISDAILAGNTLFAFGCGHSSLPTQDIFYRAGGLMLVNTVFAPGLDGLALRPPTMSSRLEQTEGLGKVIFEGKIPAKPGDLLILVSTSGRNAVPVELAMRAKQAGMKLVAITSLDYSSAVPSRHSSGKKVYELADLVLDNLSPRGDALLELPGLPQRVGSISGIAASAILQAIIVQVAENLLAQGFTPPVYMSGNLDGGMEHNERLLKQYADRIFYM